MNPVLTLGKCAGSNQHRVTDGADRVVRCALLCCTFLVLSLTPCAATDPSGEARTARIVGLGAATCSQFMADVAANPPMRRDYLAWAQGFMSGIILSRPPGVDQGLDLGPATFGLVAQLRSSKTTVRETGRSIFPQPSRLSTSGCALKERHDP